MTDERQHTISTKPGSRLTGRIDRLTPKGWGAFDAGRREVQVRRAWPGDEIEAEVVRRRRGAAQANLLAVHREATARREAPCAHVPECGGCIWQEWPIEDQRRVKRRVVENAVAAAPEPLDVEVEQARPVGPEFGYRNKMEFSFDSWYDAPLKLGLHHAGRHSVIFDLERCWLAPPAVSEVVEHVREWALRHGHSVYRSKTEQGLLRFLVVRAAAATGELMVNLVTSGEPAAGLEELAQLPEALPQVASVLHSVNTRKGSTANAEHIATLAGKSTITERIGKIEFEVSPRSFIQTNTRGAAVLYDLVAEKAGLTGTERVLDAYCGMGLIGLWLADRAAEVVGIEQVPDAVADANALRDKLGFDHVTFEQGDAEAVLPRYVDAGRTFDVAVVDPPRAGLHPKALRALKWLRPRRIVYVSCNPQALARDVSEIVRAGYRPGSIVPVDMFPQTAHVESVVRLDRA